MAGFNRLRDLGALAVANELAIEVMEKAPLERTFHKCDNPFEMLTEAQFIKMYRLSKACANDLIERVTPHINCGHRSSALNITSKVLCVLRFFASGSYQTDIGQGVNIAIHPSTVSRCIAEVSDTPNHPDIFTGFVKFPSNLNEMCKVRNRIYDRHGFPGCIGIIDCMHVAIIAPPREGEYPEAAYVNRKRYHFINVQLVRATFHTTPKNQCKVK